MTTFGSIGEFDISLEDWSSYAECLEHNMSANDVIDIGKKRFILLSTCGAATYKLIRNLTSPELPVSKTYKEIVDLVQTHYQPKPSVMIERLKFNSRIHQTGESVSTFMTELRQSSKHCDFGESLNVEGQISMWN